MVGEAREVSDGGTVDAHTTLRRRRGRGGVVVEDDQANRTEKRLVVFKDAIGAEMTVASSVTDRVEDPPLR